MKREFSYYEFVGLIIPSVVLLYFTHLILSIAYNKIFIDFSKIGESLIFIILCYSLGHVIHAFGNVFEIVLWKIYKGMPTNWLENKNRFNYYLFNKDETKNIVNKIQGHFGNNSGKDYGRLVYNFLFQKEKTKRIDIFNANYSLLRGLTISFLMLCILCLIYFGIMIALIPLGLSILTLIRMIRFAKLYAKEVYRTFYNIE